jgi:dephospho-CoA kinase
VARPDELVVVTGGIGCGKSAAMRQLQVHGWNVIDADAVARKVLDGMVGEVATRWPGAVGAGAIDRRALAELIFSRREELEELERMIYPSVRAQLQMWERSCDWPTAVEISSPRYPLEPTSYRLVVDAPDEIRRVRLIARGIGVDDLERRLLAQPARGEWLDRASAVVDNSRKPQGLEEAITTFDRYWRNR